MTTAAPFPPAAIVPRAWTTATLDQPEDWYYPLSERSFAALEPTLAALRRAPRPLQEVLLTEEQRAVLAEDLATACAALEAGRGFAIITGIDPERVPDDEAKAIYWLVGQAIGQPFAQNVQGTILYDVRDTGQSLDYGARVSVTNLESGFHTDNSFGEQVLDYVGLLCLRTARAGGVNQVVSGYAACEALRRKQPEVLAALAEPLHVDRRGGTRAGQSPTIEIPVIEWRGEEPLFRYLRYWIHAGHEKLGQPLTPAQLGALDALDAVLNRPDLRAEFSLAPGQMFFINNRWILHNRTAFEDYPEPERRRHLVRLWLQRRPD